MTPSTASSTLSTMRNRSRSFGLMHRSARSCAVDPLHQILPVARSIEQDGHGADFLGLNEGQHLKQLVEGAEAAGKDDEGPGVLHQHHLADEEVPEGERDVLVRIGCALERKLDVGRDGNGTGFLRTPVGGLHDARSAARDDGEALFAEPVRDLVSSHAVGVVLREPGRAEERDGGTKARQFSEAP